MSPFWPDRLCVTNDQRKTPFDTFGQVIHEQLELENITTGTYQHVRVRSSARTFVDLGLQTRRLVRSIGRSSAALFSSVSSSLG